MLSATGIHKGFDGLGVLRGIDLNVEKGEVVALIGPSGSGKSTLLRCLNQLETVDSGTIVLDGLTLCRTVGAVDGLTQCVDHAADHGIAHRHGDYLAGALDDAAFFDADIRAQQHDGNGIFLKVLGHTVFAVVKLEQLACHALFQTAGPGDAVAHHNDRAGLALLDGIFVMLDLRTDDLGDLFRFQLHLCLFTTQFIIVISGGNSFCALPRL